MGVGGMGMYHVNEMKGFAQRGVVSIAAVCDVDKKRLAGAAKSVGGKVDAYLDYRYVLQRKDIDAVVMATPTTGTRWAWSRGRLGQARVRREAGLLHHRGRQGDGRGGQAEQDLGAGRLARPLAARGLPGPSLSGQRRDRQGEPGRLLALRQPGRRQPRARLRPARRTGLGPVARAHAVAAVQSRYLHGVFRWLLESAAGRSAIAGRT